jgi:hypothetical protein
MAEAFNRKAAPAKAGQRRPRRMRQPAGRLDQGVERCARFLRQHFDDKRLLGSGALVRVGRYESLMMVGC